MGPRLKSTFLLGLCKLGFFMLVPFKLCFEKLRIMFVRFEMDLVKKKIFLGTLKWSLGTEAQ